MAEIRFTQAEIEALAGAAEATVESVQSGRLWQNEPPETLRALKAATRKVLRQCYQKWAEDANA